MSLSRRGFLTVGGLSGLAVVSATMGGPMPTNGVIKNPLRPTRGNYVVTPPPPPPTNLPRRLATGLMARSRARANPTALTLMKAGKGGAVVLEMNWRTMLPTNTASMNETAVLDFVADLDWAQSNGLGVLVRIFAGFNAPDWVRAAAGGPASGGGMTWYASENGVAGQVPPSGTTGWLALPRPIPLWWTASYVNNYTAFIAKLAAETRISGHPALCGFTMSLPTTQYAEPMVKQFALVDNRNMAVSCGYTQIADENSFYSGFTAHHTSMTPLGIATYSSYNDYQLVAASGGIKTDPLITIRIMEKQMEILGRFAVLENNSLQYPTTKYPTMYQRMRDARNDEPPNPIHFQTETLAKHQKAYDAQTVKTTSPQATIQMGLDWGAGAIEFPTGAENADTRWPAISLAQATSYNLQGWNNTIGLDTFHT